MKYFNSFFIQLESLILHILMDKDPFYSPTQYNGVLASDG